MIQICVLCGKRPAERKGDHLPPQSLYPKPRPINIELFKVPACRICNNDGSKYDEEFKIFIAFQTAESRSDADALGKTVDKTLGHNRRLARQIFNNYERLYAKNISGIYKPSVAISLDKQPYIEVISRMVRGYFWWETGLIMDSEAKISVFESNTTSIAALIRFDSVLKKRGCPKFKNGHTIRYDYVQDSYGSCLFMFEFFGVYKSYAIATDVNIIRR